MACSCPPCDGGVSANAGKDIVVANLSKESHELDSKDETAEVSSATSTVEPPTSLHASDSDPERDAECHPEDAAVAVPVVVPATVPVPWADTWLMRMIGLFQRIQREPVSRGAIQCASYFAALDEMSGVYDMLFSVAPVRNQLKSDLANNLGEVKERLAAAGMDAHTTTLRTLLEHDLKLLGVDKIRLHKHRSAIWGLLWVNRASIFIFAFLREIIKGRTGKEAVDTAYETLSPYHGFLTRKFVGLAMTVAPMRRDDLIVKMGLPDEAMTLREGAAFLALGEPIIQDITAMMDELDTNFLDRM
jgi:hypothetical protein